MITVYSMSVLASVTSVIIVRNYEVKYSSSACWLACAKNVNIAENISSALTQADALSYVESVLGTSFSNGGTAQSTALAAEYLSLNTQVYNYTYNYMLFGNIEHSIDLGHAIIAGLSIYINGVFQGNAHMVMINGYGNSTDGTEYVYYHDPDTGSQGFSNYYYFRTGAYMGLYYDTTVYNDGAEEK